MTRNQIEYDRNRRELAEKERANRAQEKLKGEELQETRRSNKRNEKLKQRDITIKGLQGAAKGLADVGGLISGVANDIRWHTKYPFVKLSAKVPFAKWTGQELFVQPGNAYSSFNTMGGTILDFAPVPDAKGLRSDPINIAARNLYIYIRSKNSGAANYEASDLMHILLAADSLFTQFAQARRLYRMAISHKFRNKFDFVNIALAMGYNLTPIMDDPLRFVGRLNQLIARANTIVVPKDISVIDRHVWMCDHIYTDSNTEPSQVYAFNPVLFASYDWANHIVNYKPLTNMLFASERASFAYPVDGYNPFNLLTEIETSINNLLTNDDVITIFGDILKAYGEAGLFKFGLVDELSHMTLDYSEEVLGQIRNATIYQISSRTASGSIAATGAAFYSIRQNSVDTQTVETHSDIMVTSGLVSSFVKGVYLPQYICPDAGWFSSSLYAADGSTLPVLPLSSPVLSVDKEAVSEDDVILHTRLTVPSTGQVFGGSKECYNITDSFGTEFICGAVAMKSITPSGLGLQYILGVNSVLAPATATDLTAMLVYMGELASVIAQMNYCPTLYMANALNPLQAGLATICQTYNIANPDRQFYLTLHKNVLMSNWLVPGTII